MTFVYVTHDQEEALTMSDRPSSTTGAWSRSVLPRTSTSANNEFVAGFVGVSNIVERGGRRFTIRPEKVRILEDGEVASDGLRVEDGHVRDVAYIGAVTRFAMDLDAGGEIRWSGRTSRSSQQALEQRGRSAGRLARRARLLGQTATPEEGQ